MNISDKDLDFPSALNEIKPPSTKRIQWSHIGATIAIVVLILMNYSIRDRTMSVVNLMAIILLVLLVAMTTHHFKSKSLQKSSRQKQISNEDVRHLHLARLQNRIAAEIIDEYLNNTETLTYQDIAELKDEITKALADNIQ